MEFPTKVEKAIRTPKPFNFSYYLQRAFELTNARRTAFMGATFTYLVIIVVVAIILSVVFAGYFAIAMQSALENDENVVNPAPGVLTQILGVVLAAFFIAPIPAGFAQAAFNIDKNEFLSFDHFFAGFRLPKWWHIALTYSVVAVIGLVISYPFASAMDPAAIQLLGENPAEYLTNVAGAAMLGSILMWILRSVYRWAEISTYFFEVKGWQAMEVSRQLIGANFFWFMLFDFLVIVAFFFMVFAIALGVSFFGILGWIVAIFAMLFLLCYLMPWYLNFHYAAFADRVNLIEAEEDPSQVDSIIDHFMPE